MKKLVLFICIFLSVSLMAQDKAKLQSQVAKSDAEINDPKKSEQPKTWLNRAELFVEVYNAPTKSLKTEDDVELEHMVVKLLLAKEKVLTTKSVDLVETYDVDVYADKELYYDAAGRLVFWIVTDFAVDKPLLKALEAYKRVAALDPKGSYTKKVTESLMFIQKKLNYDGYVAFRVMQNYPLASEYYEAALDCSNHQLIAAPDTTAMCMIGIIAMNSDNLEKAVAYYKKAMDAGFTAGGDIYAKYAEALKAKQDTTAAIEVLTTSFAKFPTNQNIISILINTYIEKGENPENILPYVQQAQENDPANPSVCNVEGVVYERLNDFANAEKAYKKAIEKDNSYLPAYYNLGVLYYNEGINIYKKAAEVINDDEYQAMAEQANQRFKDAIAPWETAYELNRTERSVVEFLKTVYFRFREDSEELQKKYDYYNELLQSM